MVPVLLTSEYDALTREVEDSVAAAEVRAAEPVLNRHIEGPEPAREVIDGERRPAEMDEDAAIREREPVERERLPLLGVGRQVRSPSRGPPYWKNKVLRQKAMFTYALNIRKQSVHHSDTGLSHC